MNPSFFGDSYDLVKRFFCHELASLGYVVAIEPLLTGDWNGADSDFYRLVGVEPLVDRKSPPDRKALFFDPDTGINDKGGRQHVSFERLAQEASNFDIVFSFDQAFSRQANPATVMRLKLAAIYARGCHALYYDSHARFLFAATAKQPLDELRVHLISLGLPTSRLVESGT
jgi:hypothetical protein